MLRRKLIQVQKKSRWNRGLLLISRIQIATSFNYFSFLIVLDIYDSTGTRTYLDRSEPRGFIGADFLSATFNVFPPRDYNQGSMIDLICFVSSNP